MRKIIGSVDVSSDVKVNSKLVSTSINDYLADSTGKVSINGSNFISGTEGDIILFDSSNNMYSTKHVDYVRIVDSSLELIAEKAFSTTGKIYDTTDYGIWTYVSGAWQETIGFDLIAGKIYSNSRTKKMFYVNSISDVRNVAGQSIGNGVGQVPDMSYYPANFGSIGTSGYQMLPNGLIMQWVRGDTVNGTVSLTLPYTFKSIMLGGLVNDSNSSGWGVNSLVYANIDFANSNLSQVVVNVNNISGTTSLSVSLATTPSVRILVWGF